MLQRLASHADMTGCCTSCGWHHARGGSCTSCGAPIPHLVPHVHGQACHDGGCDPAWAERAADAAGPAVLLAAAEWLSDCFGPDDMDEGEQTAAAVVSAVDRHYVGGWSAFWADGS